MCLCSLFLSDPCAYYMRTPSWARRPRSRGPPLAGHPSFEAVSWAAKFSQFSFSPGLLRRRHAWPAKHETNSLVSWIWKAKRQHRNCHECYALIPTGLLTKSPSLSHANHPFLSPFPLRSVFRHCCHCLEVAKQGFDDVPSQIHPTLSGCVAPSAILRGGHPQDCSPLVSLTHCTIAKHLPPHPKSNFPGRRMIGPPDRRHPGCICRPAFRRFRVSQFVRASSSMHQASSRIHKTSRSREVIYFKQPCVLLQKRCLVIVSHIPQFVAVAL